MGRGAWSVGVLVCEWSFHGITLPSYRVDRLDRYLKWYDRYLKPVAQ